MNKKINKIEIIKLERKIFHLTCKAKCLPPYDIYTLGFYNKQLFLAYQELKQFKQKKQITLTNRFFNN